MLLQEMKKLLQFRPLMVLILAIIIILLVSMRGTWQDIKPVMTWQDIKPATWQQIVPIKNNTLPWWETGACDCINVSHCLPKSSPLDISDFPDFPEGYGTCSRRAASDGHHQKVISFSLFGSNPDYWIGLSKTLEEAEELFPGWKVWIYTNPRDRSEILCPLLKNYSHLRVCDATNLPPPLGNLTNIHKMLWRTSPLGDPYVDALMVRDSDSKLTKREQAAVQEWRDSGKMFHTMRDHPFHSFPILGGMWGAQLWQERSDDGDISKSNSSSLPMSSFKPPSAKRLREIRDEMYKESYKQFDIGFDQDMLKKILWPTMKNVMVSHDGYFCRVYPNGWRPWPTQRENETFVGDTWYRNIQRNKTLTCPKACRPAEHQDWINC